MPKIVWPDIAKQSEFCLDYGGAIPDTTLFTIPTENKLLLALLNSPVVEWLMTHTSSQIQQDFLRFKNIYVSPLPIPYASDSRRIQIETIVTVCCKQTETWN